MMATLTANRLQRDAFEPKVRMPGVPLRTSVETWKLLWPERYTNMSCRLCSKVLFLGAAAALLASATWAQAAHNMGPKYDVTKETKIKGVVEEFREVPGEQGTLHLVVKTESQTVLVHVGPSDFLKEIDTSFNKGDQVAVIGAVLPGTSAEEEILAREITDGQNTSTLRDDKGVPVWAGWKPAKK